MRHPRLGVPAPTQLADLLGLEPSELLTSTGTAEIDVAPKVPPQPQLDGDLTVRDLQRVGQLQILRHLGSGAFGDVYAAYDATLQRSCAVKVLRGAVSPQLRARFRREAKAAMQLRHENLVAVYDYGEAEATPYLVMELVDGWTLKELLRQVGTLDPPRAARLIHQLARGLVAVHASGAVHRDVKPANILVYRSGPDERIKLTDFGLVRITHEAHTKLTGAEALGTPAYMAPEQARSAKQVGPAADVFSAGVILYELIAGRPPFATRSLAELVRATQPSAPPTPPDAQGLGAIALRMLSLDPASRPTAAALVEALEATVAFLGEEQAVPTPSGVEVIRTPAPGSRFNFALTLAATFAFAATLTAELSLRSSAPGTQSEETPPHVELRVRAVTANAAGSAEPLPAPMPSVSVKPPPKPDPPRATPDVPYAARPRRAGPAPAPQTTGQEIGRVLAKHGLRRADLALLPGPAARLLEIEQQMQGGTARLGALQELEGLAGQYSRECPVVIARLGRAFNRLRVLSATLAPSRIDVLEGKYLAAAARLQRGVAKGDCGDQVKTLLELEQELLTTEE